MKLCGLTGWNDDVRRAQKLLYLDVAIQRIVQSSENPLAETGSEEVSSWA
jgi:hypothetical protein